MIRQFLEARANREVRKVRLEMERLENEGRAIFLEKYGESAEAMMFRLASRPLYKDIVSTKYLNLK